MVWAGGYNTVESILSRSIWQHELKFLGVADADIEIIASELPQLVEVTGSSWSVSSMFYWVCKWMLLIQLFVMLAVLFGGAAFRSILRFRDGRSRISSFLYFVGGMTTVYFLGRKLLAWAICDAEDSPTSTDELREEYLKGQTSTEVTWAGYVVQSFWYVAMVPLYTCCIKQCGKCNIGNIILLGAVISVLRSATVVDVIFGSATDMILVPDDGTFTEQHRLSGISQMATPSSEEQLVDKHLSGAAGVCLHCLQQFAN
jgi:hypothetical protein